MGIKMYQVDSFTDKAFRGNPAAVCILKKPASSKWMQNVAKENNLSETAFVCKKDKLFNLRWFTPLLEVPLCGHATLAAAHILFTEKYVKGKEIKFITKSGVLEAVKRNNYTELNFPAGEIKQIKPFYALKKAVGMPFECAVKSRSRYIVEVNRADDVRNFKPNIEKIKKLDIANLVITAVSDDKKYDFISRFFGPAMGINEDPVTGAAHCMLAVYWNKKTGRTKFNAYQASERGGSMKIRLQEDRVYLLGKAVTFYRGEIDI